MVSARWLKARGAAGGIALVSCLALPRAEARGQERPLLRAGARVRLSVHAVSDGPLVLTGTLLVFAPDSVTIVPHRARAPATVAFRDLVGFEVNRGRPRGIMFGAPVLGAALGAWFGATALAPSAACRARGSDDPACRWETSPTLVGAGGGAVLFGIAATLLVPEVWQDVPVTALIVGSRSQGAEGVTIGLAVCVR
jgi:hypothetical protein